MLPTLALLYGKARVQSWGRMAHLGNDWCKVGGKKGEKKGCIFVGKRRLPQDGKKKISYTIL